MSGSRYGCKSGWRTFGDNCYRILDQSGTSWRQSQNLCQRMGGDLTSINSQREMNFLMAYSEEASQYLIIKIQRESIISLYLFVLETLDIMVQQ